MKQHTCIWLSLVTLIILSLPYKAAGQVEREWASPTPPLAKYNLIMVIAIAPVGYEPIATRQENNMVRQLIKTGIKARGLHASDSAGYILAANPDTAIERIKKAGADGVITILLLDKLADQEDLKQKTVSLPYYATFGPYYAAWHNEVNHPHRTKLSDKLVIEANMYNFSSMDILYSAYSKPASKNKVDDMLLSFTRQIIKNMKRKGPLR